MTAQPHILVVDDHAEIRHSVSRYLEKNGMRATGASNTVEMDDQLARESVDLIVLDVMMPGEDGLTACTRLRQAHCTTPILMLTALGEDNDRITGLDSGADDYLAKPFNPRELLARINAILRRASRISSGDSDSRSLPSNETSPAVGSINRRIPRPTVDLPHPLSPTTPSVSPGMT